MLGRSKTVFLPTYYEAVLGNDHADRDIFALTGVPQELFRHMRELAELAGEKEQVARMKYAIFDTTRALELEELIRDYVICSTSQLPESEDPVQNWHDYYHTSNAWRYALLLYICRVLKWDRFSSDLVLEVSTLTRLILDSVRCCRPDSSLQKQLLLPVFLAGSEAMDVYSRSLVEQYCEAWYINCRYTMFKDTLALLQDVWARRDREANKFTVWWGPIVDEKQSDGSGYLFG